MNFKQFVKSKFRNQWISEPGIKIYMRKSIYKGIDIDLANMEARKPGNGSLTKFLDKYEKDYVFLVESIVNRRLIKYLERRGYTRVQRNSPLQIDMSNEHGRRKPVEVEVD